jgi:ankyrin repeat protein
MAFEQGYLPVVKSLLTAKASLQATDKKGQTPLHKALAKGHTDLVKVILLPPTSSNKVAHLLHLAAKQGNEAACSFLLEQNCSANARDEEGHTPLHVAAAEGHVSIATTLLKNNAKVNAKNKARLTPLQIAWQ